MKETGMPPVYATNLAANSGNTIYEVEGIGEQPFHDPKMIMFQDRYQDTTKS